MTSSLTPLRAGDEVTAVGRLVVCQEQPGLLLAHERVPLDQVVTFDSAAAVALADYPDNTAVGDLIRVTGIWDGARLDAATVTRSHELVARDGIAPAASIPEAPAPFSPEGAQTLHELEREGILSGRRISYGEGISVVVVAVTDLAQAYDIIDSLQPTEIFEVRASKWSADHISAARRLALLVPEGELFSAGEYYDGDSEVHFTVSVKLVRDELAQALTDLPADLVSVTTFLQPAR